MSEARATSTMLTRQRGSVGEEYRSIQASRRVRVGGVLAPPTVERLKRAGNWSY